MSCSPFDLRDFLFGELPEQDRQQVDLHSKSCATCREELNRLRATQAALLAVADEEIPQRIGFISDRVYEPSRLLRWWRAFWGSGPRLAFASAAMLSAALIFSATHRPAPPPVDVARLQADFSRQLNEAVERVVAESDARYEQRTARLLAATGRQFEAAMMEKYARRDYRAAILRNVSQ
jgi:anti-sigma factor RsiW